MNSRGAKRCDRYSVCLNTDRPLCLRLSPVAAIPVLSFFFLLFLFCSITNSLFSHLRNVYNQESNISHMHHMYVAVLFVVHEETEKTKNTKTEKKFSVKFNLNINTRVRWISAAIASLLPSCRRTSWLCGCWLCWQNAVTRVLVIESALELIGIDISLVHLIRSFAVLVDDFCFRRTFVTFIDYNDLLVPTLFRKFGESNR